MARELADAEDDDGERRRTGILNYPYHKLATNSRVYASIWTYRAETAI